MAGSASRRGDGIAAMTGVQVARDPADGRHADAGLALHLPVGDLVLQPDGDRPAVGQGLQFRGRAEVAQEITAFFDRAQGQQGLAQRAFGGGFLAGGNSTVIFHGFRCAGLY